MLVTKNDGDKTVLERFDTMRMRLGELLVSEEISQLLAPAYLEQLRCAYQEFTGKLDVYNTHLTKERERNQVGKSLMSQGDIGGMRKSYNRWSTTLNTIFATLKQAKVMC